MSSRQLDLTSGERFWLEIKVKVITTYFAFKVTRKHLTGASSPPWDILMFRSQRHKKTAEKTENK